MSSSFFVPTNYFFVLLALLWGWGIWGLIALFWPRYERHVAMVLSQEVPLRLWGVLSIVIGILWWVSSAVVIAGGVLKLFAFLFFSKGTIMLCLSRRRYEHVLKKFSALPVYWSRVAGAASLLIVMYVFSNINFFVVFG